MSPIWPRLSVCQSAFIFHFHFERGADNYALQISWKLTSGWKVGTQISGEEKDNVTAAYGLRGTSTWERQHIHSLGPLQQGPVTGAVGTGGFGVYTGVFLLSLSKKHWVKLYELLQCLIAKILPFAWTAHLFLPLLVTPPPRSKFLSGLLKTFVTDELDWALNSGLGRLVLC